MPLPLLRLENDAKWREYIFAAFDVADAEAWKECATCDLVGKFRQNAGLSLEEVAALLGIKNHEFIGRMEKSDAPKHIDRLARVLKPVLKQVAREGWIHPQNYLRNEEQIKALGRVPRQLKTLRLVAGGWPEGVKSFDITHFSITPDKNSHGAQRPMSGIRSIAARLCALHGCASVEELFSKASRTAPKPFFVQDKPAGDLETSARPILGRFTQGAADKEKESGRAGRHAGN